MNDTSPANNELSESEQAGLPGPAPTAYGLKLAPIPLGISASLGAKIGSGISRSIDERIAGLVFDNAAFAKSVGPALDGLVQLDATLKPMIAQIGRTIAFSLAQFWTQVEPALDSLRTAFPDNVREADPNVNIQLLTQITRDEGLPVAWVPSPSVLRAVLKAGTPQRRRTVYGRRWKTIVNDCDLVLSRVTAPRLMKWVSFASKASAALASGHHEASQALSANTLDSLLQRQPDAKKSTSRGFKLEETAPLYYFVFAQLSGAHKQFHPAQGDPLPYAFSRHATVHGVSKQQFSRINAVIALAHLTSYIWFLERTRPSSL